MLVSVGDLVEDVVVRLGGPLKIGTDTSSSIVHRQGGSAANVAAFAARAGARARFVGQIGADAVGDRLIASMTGAGIDVAGHRGGRTGTVIALLDGRGERSMLTDRGASADLADPQRSWLDGAGAVHIPLYSLIGGELATTASTLAAWARALGLPVSIDTSSSAVIRDAGAAEVTRLIAAIEPAVVFCNADEASTLGGTCNPVDLGARTVIVKHGDGPAVIMTAGDGEPVAVAACTVAGVRDTTGAGDAFAAGYLVAMLAGAPPADAARAAHDLAADVIRERSASA